MAFIDITDPTKREQIVQDYMNTKSYLQQKYENEKAIGLQQKIEFEKQYEPLISATKDSASKITTELKMKRSMSEKGLWKPEFAKSAIDYYLTTFPPKNRDKYYGIQKKGDKYVMGNAFVNVDKNSNITVAGVEYGNSPGLWQLIMLNKPIKKDYSQKDADNYEDLVEATQVIFHPQVTSKNDRPETTSKYTEILQELKASYGPEEETQEGEEDKAEGTDYESVEEEEETEQGGMGIKYLPGDKKGLTERLRLLLAERQAGNNVSTTAEIVAILDALLQMGEINRVQYNTLCKTLKC